MVTKLMIIAVFVTIFMSVYNHTHDEENSEKIKIDLHQLGFKGILSKAMRLIKMGLIFFCIIIIGGVIDGAWMNFCFELFSHTLENDEVGITRKAFAFILFSIFGVVIPMVLTFSVGYCVMGLYKLTENAQSLCLIIFIISIFGWNFYYNDYNSNIEITNEVNQYTENKELLMFYQIPVQNVSDTTSDNSGYVFGNIGTTDIIPYWYINESGNGEYDTAPAENSKIVPMTEEGSPYVEISTTEELQLNVNHNTGETSVLNSNYSTVYYFYLPAELFWQVE